MIVDGHSVCEAVHVECVITTHRAGAGLDNLGRCPSSEEDLKKTKVLVDSYWIVWKKEEWKRKLRWYVFMSDRLAACDEV